ncbi:hypothetical protein AHAS_Ahas11G0201500 [Arachis hypogaea]
MSDDLQVANEAKRYDSGRTRSVDSDFKSFLSSYTSYSVFSNAVLLIRKALELIEDDQSTYVVLHRHLLRTVAAPMVDMLLHDLDEQNKLKNGVELQDAPSSESISVSPGDRVAISKSFPRPLAVADKALAVVEALEGKVGISNFTTNLLVKELTSQVSAETEPVSLLPKVVSLLYIQVTLVVSFVSSIQIPLDSMKLGYLISGMGLTEREGGQIDRSLLKNIVDIFVEVGLGKLDHYEQDFEIQMLDDTANYYKSKCTLWTEVDSFQESLWKANASRIGP